MERSLNMSFRVLASVLFFGMLFRMSGQEVIVHAKLPSAAGELQQYLQQITGRRFPVIEEEKFDRKLPAFYVGHTRFARKNGIDFTSFAPEEYLYRSAGKNLILGGHRFNGNDYAVWKFLENELGVRWYTFESTFVPRRKTLAFGKLNRRGKPAFSERDIYAKKWAHGLAPRWSAEYTRLERRNRLTRGNRSPVILSALPGFCHTFYEYVKPEKYFRSHPEYFSMNGKGKRFHGSSKDRSGGQLCLSNPEVARVASEQLITFIRQDRSRLPKEKWPTMYDISQCDSTYEICLCPECKKLTAAEGSESALVVTFLNRIAKRIGKEYPEITLRTFAYISTGKAPKTLRAAGNVLIRWCDVYGFSDCYRPLNSPHNAAQKKELDAWKKQGARIGVWDYWNMDMDGAYFTPPRVETIVDAIAPDIRYFRSSGVEMVFVEAECTQFINPQNFYDLHFYLGSQLLDEPDKDENVLIADFLKNHYGPAGGKMREVLDRIRSAVRNEKNAMFYVSNRPFREYQTGTFLRQVYEKLKEAHTLTPPGSDWRYRVEKEMITPIGTILSNPHIKTGLDRKKLLREYKALRLARIEKYADPKKKTGLIRRLETDVAKYGFEAEIPEQFKKYFPDRIRLLAYPDFVRSVPDPDSVTGRTYPAPREKEDRRHVLKPQVAGYLPTYFGVYDYESRKSAMLRLKEIPQDEKYHWYKVGRFEIGKRSVLWGFFWLTQIPLSQLWTPADGLKDFNIWTFWISVKVTGPAYVKNSTRPNQICLDQVILVKE